MKRLFSPMIMAVICLLEARCGSHNQAPGTGGDTATGHSGQPGTTDTVIVMTGINSKGIGRFRDVRLTHPLDEHKVAAGETIYRSKCFACHKLTDELLVGPGWKGVTDRRTPEWIMNWITNTKVMLDKDLAARADMAICLIRMPNQDLTDDQARDVLEFMRRNDGGK